MARSSILASSLPATLLFLLSFPMPLGADVVPISISGQTSVSGYVQACDPFCQGQYHVQDNGSSFSSTGNGSASDSVPVALVPGLYYVRTADVDASAGGQVFTWSPTNLNLGLFVSDEFSGNATLMQGSAIANSQYLLVFDLTSPYLVELTGGISPFESEGGGIYVSSFDAEIHFTGPGFQFDQAFNFDQVFTLGPGQYTLDAVAGLNDNDYDYLDANSFYDVSLNADFTAIPEPAPVSIVLGLLMLAGISVARLQAVSR